jgi:hypothetical protein
MCTPWASDRAVLVPDWAGLRSFSAEWRISGGWTRFESHLGHVFSLSGAFWCFFGCTLCTLLPLI